jgi:lipopolysaccharide cholinephosphotransferase
MEINIPDGFFNGEIRNGFYVEKMMKKNWACMIKVLSEIDRICRKYGITYFADWGTLLGAARHKGFIPWDDDIDIGMLRDDYELFNSLAADELPAGWEILNIHNDKCWNETFEHVTTGRSVCRDKKHLDEFYGFPYVAGVDIFPYDYVAPTEEEKEYVNNLEKVALNAAQCYKYGTYTAEEKEAMLAQVEQLFNIKLDRKGNMLNQLLKLYDKLAQLYSADEASYVSSMSEYPEIRKECFSEIIYLDFEYIKIPAPVNYEEVLEKEFGKDWRVPLLMTGDHEYPYYKKQQLF